MFKVVDTLNNKKATVYAVRENDGEIEFLVYRCGWRWHSSTRYVPVEN